MDLFMSARIEVHAALTVSYRKLQLEDAIIREQPSYLKQYTHTPNVAGKAVIPSSPI